MTSKHLLLLLMVIISSCQKELENNQGETVLVNDVEQVIKTLPTDKMKVISYKDCEYLVYKHKQDANSSFGFMAHKGNFSNPVHNSCSTPR